MLLPHCTHSPAPTPALHQMQVRQALSQDPTAARLARAHVQRPHRSRMHYSTTTHPRETPVINQLTTAKSLLCPRHGWSKSPAQHQNLRIFLGDMRDSSPVPVVAVNHEDEALSPIPAAQRDQRGREPRVITENWRLHLLRWQWYAAPLSTKFQLLRFCMWQSACVLAK